MYAKKIEAGTMYGFEGIRFYELRKLCFFFVAREGKMR